MATVNDAQVPLLSQEAGGQAEQHLEPPHLSSQRLSKTKTLFNAAMAAALFMADADDKGHDPDWEIVQIDEMARPPRDFRILDRSAPFCQSHGKLNIHRIHRDKDVFLADPFHTLMETNTPRLLLSFWILYCLTFALFAVVYWSASRPCGIGCDRYFQALFLSVETMLTIGYGVPDQYFRPCPWLTVPLVMQMLLAVIYNALFVGVVYQRISRGTTRASTILFSDKAAIRRVGNSLYLTFRVCEMHRTQLLDSHFRCYLFTWERQKEGLSGRLTSSFRQDLMRLEQPDDSVGARALLILPTTVVHKIDAFSPLLGRAPEQLCGTLSSLSQQPELASLQRSSDSQLACRDGVWCKACGSSYPGRTQLERHIKYSGEEELRDGSDYAPHAELMEEGLEPPESLEELRARLEDRMDSLHMEVLCVLEGVDAKTSSSVQVRHSYTVEDIVWDQDFAPCVAAVKDADVEIDFGKFHDMVPC